MPSAVLALAGPCGRNPSGHRHPEAVGQCHHRTDQGKCAVAGLPLPCHPVWIPGPSSIRNGAEKLLGKGRHALLSGRIPETAACTGRLCVRRRGKAAWRKFLTRGQGTDCPVQTRGWGRAGWLHPSSMDGRRRGSCRSGRHTSPRQAGLS